MKRNLNNTFVKTTNNFMLNSFSVDFDIPCFNNFHNFLVSGINDYKEELKENYQSNIGLTHEKYLNLVFDLGDSEDNANIKYEFNKIDSLVDCINIDSNKPCTKDVIITYSSLDDNNHFHDGKLIINASNESNINVTILNLMNSNSINLLDIEIKSSDKSKVNINIIDVGGNTRIYRCLANTYKESSNSINMAYIGKDENKIDINFNYINNGVNSNNTINVEGLLKDKSLKHFKGIIDFKKGAINSIGKERENVMILNEEVISRSLPIMLCEEENVDGSHSTSSGVLDKDNIYYLMTHGIDEEEAKKMLIMSNFGNVTKLLPSMVKEEIDNIIISNL